MSVSSSTHSNRANLAQLIRSEIFQGPSSMTSMATCSSEDPTATATASQPETSPFLALPLELRYAIYRHCLISPSGKVEVVSNYLGTQKPRPIRFYTVRNLSLLEANRQIRAEASEQFYAENIFTLNSYSRTQEYGQEPLYGSKSHHINYNRVRKAHILTPRGFFPASPDSCIKGAERMRGFFEGIADALASDHCMRYMLIQSYDFERAPFHLTGERCGFNLAYILEPLEKVRGLHTCHIRAMKMSLWPYIRFLEREMTKSCSDPSGSGGNRRPIVEKALMCKKIITERVGIVDAFGDPDFPLGNKVFEIFKTKPLYNAVDFLDLCDLDLFNES